MNAALLLKHYGRIADAPDAIAQLRRFVLDLAVRGKLVGQDARDEPASKLLPEFESEKALRIARKEMRKSKNLELGKEIPFELPSSWLWLPIGGIGNIFSGSSINEAARDRFSRAENGRPFIATKDVGYGFEDLNYNNGLLVPASEDRFKTARPNTPLICVEGGSAGRKIGLCDREICFGNKLIANEVWSQVAPRYVLCVYLSTFFYDQFRAQMTGVIGGISLNRFLELHFPLPPHNEQHRIVAKVDELMALCDQLEAARAAREATRDTFTLSTLTKLNTPDPETFGQDARFALANLTPLTTRTDQIKQLRRTILNLAVAGKLVDQNAADAPIAPVVKAIATPASIRRKSRNGPTLGDGAFDIPKSWIWATLGQVITYGPKNGLSPKSVNDTSAPKAITLTATTSGWFNPLHFKHVEARLDPASEFWLQDGDLLFQRGNTREYVGMAAIYRGQPLTFIYPDLMMRVRIAESLCLPFIHLCAIAPYAREYMAEHAAGAQETMPKINQATLVALPIPLPPVDEQSRIVAKVDELMALCDELEVSITAGEKKRSRLLEAVLHNALEPA